MESQPQNPEFRNNQPSSIPERIFQYLKLKKSADDKKASKISQ